MAPYSSDKQRKFFHAALAKGKIKKSVVDEFDKASKGLDLPEYKEPKIPKFKRIREKFKI